MMRGVAGLIGAVAAVFAISPAGAQVRPEVPPAGDVVVTGSTEKLSDWKRADADHVVVYSDGSADELARVTRNIERLHALMSRIYRRGATSDETLPLQVTLVGSSNAFRSLDLTAPVAEDWSYARRFANPIYYSATEEGATLVMARSDQIIDLNTNRRFNYDCDAIQTEGDVRSCGEMVPDHDPVARGWEASLYAAYAQHFIRTYVPAAYPGWYLDGVGALFSTITVRGDGGLDYATAPRGYREIYKSYGQVNVGDVLAGRPTVNGRRYAGWTPYHAWLLAHYFLFSNPGPKRSAQLREYMTAVHRGTPLADAAKLFGDPRSLQGDIVRYSERAKAFARTQPAAGQVAAPLVTRLSIGAAAIFEARLALDARSANRVDRVRDRLAGASDTAEAAVTLAAAECRAGRADRCLEAADRALALAPDDARALSWRGIALLASGRPGAVTDARASLERAIESDPQASLPRVALFRSFADAGTRVPDTVMAGLARVVRAVPAAPGPRLCLGEELVRRGDVDLARRLLNPILYGSAEGPEHAAAQRLFAMRVDAPAPL